MSFLGIDLGTSFIKGAVLNLETRRLEHVRRTAFPDPIRTGDPLRCEFDPKEILRAFQNLVAELAPLAPDCEGLVMCTQMHGLVVMNDRREPCSNCITWRDQRVLEKKLGTDETYFDAILAQTTAEERRQLGNELDPARPICFLYWLREQGKLSPGLIPASLPDFVLSALSGEQPGVEATNASAYGAFNLQTADWHRDVIGKLGLGHLRWPEIRRQGDIAAHLTVGSGSIPCYAPIGDAQAALLGSLLSREELSLNIATGAQVSRLVDELTLGDYQTRPYFDDQYLNTFSYPPAGRELNILVSLLTEFASAQNIDLPDPWTYIASATEKPATTDVHVDLRFFSDAGGGIGGLRPGNATIAQLFRAAFRGMAEEYHECALKLWPDQSWKNVSFSGGLACKMKALREEVQRKFNTDFRMPVQTEDTLYGLMILASVFSGRAKSVEALSSELRAK
jgi:sugar (pentulose or hexulose) kinase